ncbi:MAG TPA: hypothetical protein VHS03_07030 [Gaiellaceae bacterium]|nr:hypothetical protein [Gaiellaceae bacterium]
MLERVAAAARRRRARKFITVGENWTFEYDTPIGVVMLHGRFEEEDETLILIFLNIYAKDVLEKGEYQAEPGLASVRKFLEWVAEMAVELGYTRMRVAGARTKRNDKRGGRQRFEFDLAKFLRGAGAAR